MGQVFAQVQASQTQPQEEDQEIKERVHAIPTLTATPNLRYQDGDGWVFPELKVDKRKEDGDEEKETVKEEKGKVINEVVAGGIREREGAIEEGEREGDGETVQEIIGEEEWTYDRLVKG